MAHTTNSIKAELSRKGYAPSTARAYAGCIHSMIRQDFDGSPDHPALSDLSPGSIKLYLSAWRAWAKRPPVVAEKAVPDGLFFTLFGNPTADHRRRWLPRLERGRGLPDDDALKPAFRQFFMTPNVIAAIATLRRSGLPLHRLWWGDVRYLADKSGWLVDLERVQPSSKKITWANASSAGRASVTVLRSLAQIDALDKLLAWAAPLNDDYPLVPIGGGSRHGRTKAEIKRLLGH